MKMRGVPQFHQLFHMVFHLLSFSAFTCLHFPFILCLIIYLPRLSPCHPPFDSSPHPPLPSRQMLYPFIWQSIPFIFITFIFTMLHFIHYSYQSNRPCVNYFHYHFHAELVVIFPCFLSLCTVFLHEVDFHNVILKWLHDVVWGYMFCFIFSTYIIFIHCFHRSYNLFVFRTFTPKIVMFISFQLFLILVCRSFIHSFVSSHDCFMYDQSMLASSI